MSVLWDTSESIRVVQYPTDSPSSKDKAYIDLLLSKVKVNVSNVATFPGSLIFSHAGELGKPGDEASYSTIMNT